MSESSTRLAPTHSSRVCLWETGASGNGEEGVRGKKESVTSRYHSRLTEWLLLAMSAIRFLFYAVLRVGAANHQAVPLCLR